MSYHIYTTDGIILKRTTFGEANILLHILTEDLGLIIASARSARLAVSKLRPALQEYALVSVSVIHGKGGWKITNVVENSNLFFDCTKSARRVLSQIGSTLLQMIPGEQPHSEVFRTVESGFEFLKIITETETKYFEILLLLRILYVLGYVAKSSDNGMFLENLEFWDTGILQDVEAKKLELVGLINKALKESHL